LRRDRLQKVNRVRIVYDTFVEEEGNFLPPR
jgi:hypothetical protein